MFLGPTSSLCRFLWSAEHRVTKKKIHGILSSDLTKPNNELLLSMVSLICCIPLCHSSMCGQYVLKTHQWVARMQHRHCNQSHRRRSANGNTYRITKSKRYLSGDKNSPQMMLQKYTSVGMIIVRSYGLKLWKNLIAINLKNCFPACSQVFLNIMCLQSLQIGQLLVDGPSSLCDK